MPSVPASPEFSCRQSLYVERAGGMWKQAGKLWFLCLVALLLAAGASFPASGREPESAAASPRSLREYRRLATSLVRSQSHSQDLQDAVERYVASNTGHWTSLLLTGMIYERNGLVSLAGESYEKSYACRGGNADPVIALIRWRMGQGRTQGVVRLCDEAIALQPDDFNLRLLKAAALEREGRYDQAQDCLLQASGLMLQSLEPAVREDVELVLSGQGAKSAERAKKRQGPRSRGGPLDLLIASGLLQSGKQDEGTRYLQSAFRQDPLKPMVAQVYARVLIDAGRQEEALEPMLALLAVNLAFDHDPGQLADALRTGLSTAPAAKVDEYARFVASKLPDRELGDRFMSEVDRLRGKPAERLLPGRPSRQAGNKDDIAAAMKDRLSRSTNLAFARAYIWLAARPAARQVRSPAASSL